MRIAVLRVFCNALLRDRFLLLVGFRLDLTIIFAPFLGAASSIILTQCPCQALFATGSGRNVSSRPASSSSHLET